MGDEYTPTTEQVRAHYAFHQGDTWVPNRKDDFDRWLREHDAKVWDEGYTRGFYDRERLSGDSRDASEGATDNPHHAALRVGANPKEND